MMLLLSSASAQPIEAVYMQPDDDRWNYPFNAVAGLRSVASVFGATNAGPGFDDRDAQFVVAFDTSAQIPAGQPAINYQITSLVLTAYIAAGDQLIHDDTYDSFVTHLADTDPLYIADADPGRPVELFGAGYRNGFNSATWTEFSSFGGAAAVPPAQGARNVFPASFASDGTATDLSNHIKEGFEVVPVSVGTVAGVAPGALVPQDASMTFDASLTDPGFVRFVQESLSAGKLNLVVSGLNFAIGGPDGGDGDPQYPAFYTKEDAAASILGLMPTLEITVEIASPVDFNDDGFIDNGDIVSFVAAFLEGHVRADVNNDGFIDNGDIGSFVELFLAAVG